MFKYTVSAGQDTSDLQIAGVVTSGASVKDTTGSHSSADFSYVPNSDLGLAVDTRAPSITNVRVTVSSGGTAVGLGGTVAIELQLSEAVVVSGTPTLKLSDGGTAVYVSGGSSNPASGSLEFDYTVGSGQNTADLTISSLSLLSGATITRLCGQSRQSDAAGRRQEPAPDHRQHPAERNLGDHCSVIGHDLQRRHRRHHAEAERSGNA